MRINFRHIFSALPGALLTALLLAAFGLLQVSCSRGGDGEPERPDAEADGLWLSVDIRNLMPGDRMPRTRGEAVPTDGEGHPDEDDFEAENHIDVNDINLLLFDSGNHLIGSYSSADCKIEKINAGEYRLLMKVAPSVLEEAVGSSDHLTFTVMLVANLHGTGEGDGAYTYTQLLNSVKTLSDMRRGFGYVPAEGTEAWTPSIEAGRLIPMAGTVTATLSKDAIAKGTSADNPATLPAIYLQRAMAQLRLVDAIDDENLEITGVTLRGCNLRGAYLPALAEGDAWSFNTQVVEYGTAEAGWYDASGEYPSEAITFRNPHGGMSGLVANKSYSAFRFYVPEFDWDAIGSAHGPMLMIDVLDKKKGTTKSYTYRFPRTREEADGPVQADFARNHIYQVVVTGVLGETEVGLKIAYGVCPWDTRTVDIPPFE